MSTSKELLRAREPVLAPGAESGSMISSWHHPPANPELGAEALQIWCIDLDKRSTAEYHQLGRLLSDDEVARARRFRYEQDRRRYIVGRGLLRWLLGRYLDRAPERVRFSYLEQGKPVLKEERAAGTLHFNLSHSAGIALYALTGVGPVGVDIEHISPFAELDEVAARHFSPRESMDLRRAAATDRAAAFYRCWTRKEAFIKAIGQGLSWPLHSFSVSLLPDESARLLSVVGEPQAPAYWSLHDLAPAPGMAAAVAIKGRVARVDCWYWDEAWSYPSAPSRVRSSEIPKI